MNFASAGKWFGLASVAAVLIFSIVSVTSLFNPVAIVFAVIGFFLFFFLMLVEVKFLQKCCPTGPKIDAMLRFFDRPPFKTILYAIYSGYMILTLIIAGSLIAILPLLTCLGAFGCYGIALMRKENTGNNSMV